MAFEIVNEFSTTNKRYGLSRKGVTFKLTSIPNEVADVETWIKRGIKDIIGHIVQDVEKSDKVGFTFTSDSFHKEGYIPFREAEKITFEEIWSLLGSIYQSNSTGFKTDTFRMTATIVKSFRGSGRVRSYNSYEEECRSRRGIISINNKDNLCFPRALVVAMAYVMNVPNLKQIRQNIRKRQDQEAENLIKASGIIIPAEGSGIEEVRQFQNYLKDFKITVYAYNTKGRDVLFEGPDAVYKINLLHHQNHFNVLTNISAAFCCGYYCETCHVPYNNKYDHRCIRSCPCCLQTPPCEKTDREVLCDDCNRMFRSTQCYNKHKTRSVKMSSVCNFIKRCKDCMKTIKADRKHQCEEVFCKICNKHVLSNHYCFIQPNKGTPKTKDMLFIFYDLETRQDKILEDGRREHIPNLCVFQKRCHLCIDEEKLYFCQKCGYREVIYKDDVILSFMNHILTMRKKFKNIIIIAHFGQGFDHQFLLKYALEKTDLKLDLIMRGSKIIMMGLDNIKFIDSLNYLPMALSALPKAFDLGNELKKGYFPHLFNRECNINYVGPLPDIEHYEPDKMKDVARLEFFEWHKNHKNDLFNMQQELTSYCQSDVDILTKACLKFRKMFLDECNVCPFTEAVTIASATNLVFRRNFLKENTIGVIPLKGYRCRDNQSKIAIQWLIWEESRRSINIQHAAKKKEATVSGVNVDGFCVETNEVFEFYGCYFHGHTCITTNRNKPIHNDSSDTLNNRYERTIAKADRLKRLDYGVIEMWECEFRAKMQANKEIVTYTENHYLMTGMPLNPRDAFYGGRTGNTKTYYQVKKGEKIKYCDVTSLYPWVSKTGKFPIGHPQVYVDEQCQRDLHEVEGLIKCKILPPTDLFHPVLPAKMNNKLMFVLCRTCGDLLNQGECIHNEQERALTGTWVIEEIRKAIEKGYKVMEIYEIWSYDVEQYDAVKKTGGLFTDMMNKFIKIKQEASGFPSDCTTQEEKDQYIQDYLKGEGVQLEFSKIMKNAGLRSLAKLILNSFWGKFGQRENQSKTSVIRQPSELYAIINDPSKQVNSVYEVDEMTVIVSWEHIEGAADLLPTVNVAIAAYTTSLARLKLYSYLEQLGNRVLYYDTDSVIYISKDGEIDIPTGTLLGEMTDELEEYGPGSYIVAFASGGPKNYGYVVFSPQYQTYFTVCKVKGFCLDFNATKLIHFYSMKVLATDEENTPISIVSSNITRDKRHSVITKAETKMYRKRSEKRHFDGCDSVPYGYKKLKTL